MSARQLLSFYAFSIALCLAPLSSSFIAQFQASEGNLTIKVVRLRADYKENPIGIDDRKPRFSWQLQAGGRGVTQAAYQIRVARTAADLQSGKNLSWDSGKINSGESIHQEYSGAGLQSGQCYYWQARVWDASGKDSGWSDAAYFEMGLLDASAIRSSRPAGRVTTNNIRTTRPPQIDLSLFKTFTLKEGLRDELIQTLRPHILQNPDSSGNFHKWQDEAVGRKGQLHDSDISQNHLSGAFKRGHAKGGAHSLAAGRIESYAPDVEEARAIGNEVDLSPIRRPAGFVIEVFAFRDAFPFAACGGDDVNCRNSGLNVFGGAEADPTIVGREARLIEVLFRVGSDDAHLCFGVRGSRQREQADHDAPRVYTSGASQQPLPIGRPIRDCVRVYARSRDQLLGAAPGCAQDNRPLSLVAVRVEWAQTTVGQTRTIARPALAPPH